MTDVLILGGTGWLSGRVAERWRDAGAQVTCLARGSRPAPEGVQLVIGDREDGSAYDGVSGREWDEVIDISSIPAHVDAAVTLLGSRTRHWTYVSSVSAYADIDLADADEGAPLSEPLRPGEEYDYSRAKAAAEAAVRAALPDRAAIVRPGLVVGPGDPTDRFGYWVGRFALADAEPVLAPRLEGRGAQVIDVDDVADFVVRCGADESGVTANAVGDPTALSALIALARATAGHTGELVEADDDWLEAHDVAYWMGPRSLPLWLPPDMPGFTTRSHAAYSAAGGKLRDLADTMTRTLADERERGLDRERRAGLSRSDERTLLAELSRV